MRVVILYDPGADDWTAEDVAGVMQADDKAFVRTNAPNANRRSLVDGEKAIVIGANAGTLGGVIKKLSERFNVQDFSKLRAENANSNVPANANMH